MRSRSKLQKIKKHTRKGLRSYWVRSASVKPAKSVYGSGAGHSAKLGAIGGFATGFLGGNRLIGGMKTTILTQTAAHGVANELHGRQKGFLKRHAATAIGTFAGNFAGVAAHEGLRYGFGRKSIFGQRASFR